MRFCFWGTPLTYPGDVLDSKDVGGSECAVYYMRDELQKLGHTVNVIDSQHPDPALGIYYDVFVAVRYPEIFQAPIQAKVRILWCHDIPVNHAEIKRVKDKIDHVFVLSYYHRDTLLYFLPELVDKVWITSGGVDLMNVTIAELDTISRKEKGLVLYTSRPERGLDTLKTKIMPLLAKHNLRLEVTGYLANRLTKREYYQLLSRAQLVLYPVHFPEIFCCSAIEAQAAGTPIVTTNDWALREVVADPDCRVTGSPFSEKYQKEFVDVVENLLTDPGSYQESQRIGISTTKKFGWHLIAKRWLEKLTNL